jgi:monoamine oxidase
MDWKPDVLIIGAGMAGLAAARALCAAQLNVAIIEARPHIGGRVLTAGLAPGGAAIELGAEFIHGKPREIWEIIQRGNLAAREGERDQWCLREGGLTKCNRFFEQVDRVLKQMSDRGPDRSFLEFLRNCCQEQTEETKSWAREFVAGFHAADPDRVSEHSLVNDLRADEAVEGDRGFRLGGGYEQLVYALAQQIPFTRARFLLNTVVEEIRWRQGHVEIAARTRDHEIKLQAPRVLITLPLGVLQVPTGEPGAVQFTPPLEMKRTALHQLEMGAVIRVSLVFRRRFWLDAGRGGEQLRNLSFLFSHHDWFPTWWTPQPWATPMLTGWAAGPRGRALSHKPKQFVLERAIEALSSIFRVSPSAIAEEAVSWHTHDWQADPFSRGAYSWVCVGGEGAQRELAAPVDNTLFFAGEATDWNGHHGTVHGAIASGERAAGEISASLCH